MIVFIVTPDWAAWRAIVFHIASAAERLALLSIRFGIGSRTAVELTLRIRPQRRWRISGRIASTNASGLRTSASKASRHSSWLKLSGSGEVGGPPVLVTRISIGPR